jgi:hypothetical protein
VTAAAPAPQPNRYGERRGRHRRKDFGRRIISCSQHRATEGGQSAAHSSTLASELSTAHDVPTLTTVIDRFSDLQDFSSTPTAPARRHFGRGHRATHHETARRPLFGLA